MQQSVRIDKWLWAVRLFKTRSQAAEACKGNKIRINGIAVKPSREVHEGEILEVHVQGIKKQVKVLKVVKNRVSAKGVPELMEDITPAEELEKLEMIRQLNFEKRDRGAGRPTKKERRILEKLKKNR